MKTRSELMQTIRMYDFALYDLMLYLDKVKEVFKDAETVNPEIAVIFGDITDNLEFPEEEEDEDSYLLDDQDLFYHE